MNTDDQRQSLQAAFDASNAIADLEGLPFTGRMRRMQARIVAGELSFEEAIAEIIVDVSQRQPKP